MYVTELLLNGWADFDEIFSVFEWMVKNGWYLDGLDSQLVYQVVPLAGYM